MITVTKPRSLLSLLWESFRLLGRHFLPLLVIGVLPGLPIQLLSQSPDWPPSPMPLLSPGDAFPWKDLLYPFLIVGPLSLLLYPLIGGALVHAVSQVLQEQPIHILSAFQVGLRRWPALLGAEVLMLLAFAGLGLGTFGLMWGMDVLPWQNLGGLILVLPGAVASVYLFIRWSFLAQAVVLEDFGPCEALGYSSQVVAGAWWRVAGMEVLVGVVSGLVGVVLEKIGKGPALFSPGLTGLPYAVGLTVLYFDIWGRKEVEPVPEEAKKK